MGYTTEGPIDPERQDESQPQAMTPEPLMTLVRKRVLGVEEQ